MVAEFNSNSHFDSFGGENVIFYLFFVRKGGFPVQRRCDRMHIRQVWIILIMAADIFKFNNAVSNREKSIQSFSEIFLYLFFIRCCI